MNSRWLVLLLCALLGPALADDKKKDKDDDIQPYDEVIPEDAETQVGLFRVHRVDDALLYEIPQSAFDRDMLWVFQIQSTTEGSSYAGMPAGNRVVRWELRGEKVLLRRVSYGIRAETDDPIAGAVEASNLAPIIAVFPIKAWGRDQAPVINVTRLFTGGIPELSARFALGSGSIDDSRSFIERFRAFPTNIETEVLGTYGSSNERSSGITALVHHSLVQLPDEPMQPRRHDARVGFFSVGFTDYADDTAHEAARVRYVTRWRLEKQDPEAELSDPVQPIVFYVGREVPEKWKPFIKAGIDAWQPAFEAAGFSNAIVGKYPPDAREDPDWDPEDARISSIRWLPSTTENAFGPHVHDPRSGEILEADIRMYHNVQKLVRDWYFIQCAATDPQLAQLPMPDALMGQLIQFVTTHEVGHSLGLPHNFKASSSYSIAQLRDPQWTAENGTAPSIMDYARFNYVAQPGDGAALMPGVGPYDHFAVEWGYRGFAEDAEAEGLAAIVARQIDEPMFRFGQGDASAQTEDLGDDPVEASRLGILNLERIAANLVTATSRPGQDYGLLQNMNEELWGQYRRELGHVTSQVGGYEEINLWYGDAEQRYFSVDPEDQKRAVAFLLERAMHVPPAFVDPALTRRLSGEGSAQRVLSAQRSVLGSLLSESRLRRMAEDAEELGEAGYRPDQLLADLSAGLFSELGAYAPSIGLYRRNLQRVYLGLLLDAAASPSQSSDRSALARAELLGLDQRLKAAAGFGPLDAAHIAELVERTRQGLEGE